MAKFSKFQIKWKHSLNDTNYQRKLKVIDNLKSPDSIKSSFMCSFSFNNEIPSQKSFPRKFYQNL